MPRGAARGLNASTCTVADLRPDAVTRTVARATVAFGFLVRDGESYLARNLGAIMNLGKRFAAYRVFYLENDSKDATRSILRQMEKMHPGRLVGRMVDNAAAGPSRALCDSTQLRARKSNCAARISLLSRLRQQVLEAALAWDGDGARGGWTAYVAIDLDFISFDAEAYLRSFAMGMARKAAAVFAKSVCRNGHGHEVLYDHAALEFDQSWLTSAPRGKQFTFYRAGRTVPASVCYVCNGLTAVRRGCHVPVRSAFGGFGTYFGAPLRRAQAVYVAGSNNEHRGFNEAIAQLHADEPQLFLDGSFAPRYRWGGNDFWDIFCAQARERRLRGRPIGDDATDSKKEETWARWSAQLIRDNCINRRWPRNETNASWVHPRWGR